MIEPAMRAQVSQANELTNQIIDYLYRNGIFSWRANSIGLFDEKIQRFRSGAKKGVSDILAVIPPAGKLLAIEVKIGKDKLSMEQAGFLKNVEYYGGLSFVAKDFPSFKEWLDNLIHNSS